MGGLRGSCCVAVTDAISGPRWLPCKAAVTQGASSIIQIAALTGGRGRGRWGLWASVPPGWVGVGTPGRNKVGGWENTLSCPPLLSSAPRALCLPRPLPKPCSSHLFPATPGAPPRTTATLLSSPVLVLGSVPEVDRGILGRHLDQTFVRQEITKGWRAERGFWLVEPLRSQSPGFLPSPE